jgi:hypothetical protein
MFKKLVGAVVGLVILVSVWSFFHLLVNNKLNIGYNKGYQPDQPLPFSHKLHAGELALDCKYCHASAEVSRHSAVPSLNICMNCHINLNKQSKYLDQLKEAYNSGDSIAWVKVHMLPDHVKFNHAPHIKAGKDCNTCHGPIETMEKVYQYSDLSMGWCVNCHREQMESSHGKYSTAADGKSKMNELPPGSKEDEKWTPSIINCSTCHY